MAKLFWTAASVQNLITFTLKLFSTIFQLYHNDQLSYLTVPGQAALKQFISMLVYSSDNCPP